LNNNLYVWDIYSNKCKCTISDIKEIEHMIVSTTFNTLFTINTNKDDDDETYEMKFWDISNGKCKQAITATSQINSCETSSDGNWILVNSVQENGTLLIYDFNGRLFNVIENIAEMDVWQNSFYVFDKFTEKMELYQFKKLN